MIVSSDRGDTMIGDMLRFSGHTFATSALALSWLSASQVRQAPSVIGMGDAFLNEYFRRGIIIDPFLSSLDAGVHCSSLDQLAAIEPAGPAVSAYTSFLHHYGYRDEMNFTFTIESTPIAVLSLFGEQPFAFDPDRNSHLHEFLSSYIACHPHSQRWRRQQVLQNTFDLTPREVEVVEQLCAGHPNNQVATHLGVSLATVKTHVARVLDKVGVASRSALAAFVHQL